MLNASFHGEPIVLDPPWYGWQKRGRSTPAGLPEAMTERAPFRDLLRSTLTIAVHRVASRYDAAGGVQVTLEDRRGLALGATWAALP